ncbi:MAG: UDP-N-acetylmuramoyl-tripeptide--D-alanyl-D-alanine ligase [Bacteroidales bacterium]|nr:UDP-N-acetylmuramoyl-tripeptide--D-alanyl-D-alanine ligase [Bacteroidales bacterium]
MKIEDLYSLFRAYPKVVTDSRNCTEDSIFFALKGEHFNGNCFARQAIKSGCAYAIVDEAAFADEKANILLVDNVLRTLQKLANYHRRQFSIPVIGITGTNGKTTTKELIAAVLERRYNVLWTKGNFNNHLGVPLTLLQLQKEHDIAVIEMGASHPGEIKELCAIVEPTHGLITNVGKGHLEGFGSFDGVIKTKTELYVFLCERNGTVFLHNENTYLADKVESLSVVRYGTSEGLYTRGKIIGNDPFFKLEWLMPDNSLEIQTQLIGDYNFCNVLASICVGSFFNVPELSIVDAIADYAPVNNRSQLKVTDHNRLIVDVYNANPSSMQAAVDNFISMQVEHKCVILGDMLELGVSSEEEHQLIIERLKKGGFDKVLLCGKEFSSLSENPFNTFENTDRLVDFLSANPIKESYILLKGSRGMHLERAVELL